MQPPYVAVGTRGHAPVVHGPLLAGPDGQAGAGPQQVRDERLRRPHRLHGRRALRQLRRDGRRQRAPRAVRVARAASGDICFKIRAPASAAAGYEIWPDVQAVYTQQWLCTRATGHFQLRR